MAELSLSVQLTVIQGDMASVTADAAIHPTNASLSLSGEVGKHFFSFASHPLWGSPFLASVGFCFSTIVAWSWRLGHKIVLVLRLS